MVPTPMGEGVRALCSHPADSKAAFLLKHRKQRFTSYPAVPRPCRVATQKEPSHNTLLWSSFQHFQLLPDVYGGKSLLGERGYRINRFGHGIAVGYPETKMAGRTLQRRMHFMNLTTVVSLQGCVW